MTPDILIDAEAKMDRAIKALKEGLVTIRTGRATPALVDSIKVDYHGVLTPLNQIASISIPEARLIVIQPWDRSSLANIERAILKANIGINPTNDGNVIRLAVPPPTEEGRREIARMLWKKVEGGKVELRNLRRSAMKELREWEKGKEMSQDEYKRALEQLDKLTESFIDKTDQIGEDKEKEIMEI